MAAPQQVSTLVRTVGELGSAALIAIMAGGVLWMMFQNERERGMLEQKRIDNQAKFNAKISELFTAIARNTELDAQSMAKLAALHDERIGLRKGGNTLLRETNVILQRIAERECP